MAAPPVGWARVWSTDPPLELLARMSDERPNIDSGFGGWDEVERPRRSPLTTWKGAPGVHLSLPLLLDRFAADQSVEPDIARLIRMGQPSAADGQPPQLQVDARGAALPYQGRTWVLADLSWGAAEMNRAGNRTRQQVTLLLLEFIEDVHLAERSAANRRRAAATAKKKKAGGKAKRVTAKRKKPKKSSRAVGDVEFGSGEDLLTIAARELGDADRWVEIAALNQIRDPRSIAPGQVLRLP